MAPAAVNREALSRDVSTIIRGQEREDRLDGFRRQAAGQTLFVFQFPENGGLIREKTLFALRLDRAQVNTIHPDAARPKVPGQSAGQPDDSTFARMVMSEMLHAEPESNAADIEDHARAISFHMGDHPFAAAPRPIQIRVQHVLPVGKCHFIGRPTGIDACVVDEHIDASKPAGNLGNRLFDVRRLRDIHLYRNGGRDVE